MGNLTERLDQALRASHPDLHRRLLAGADAARLAAAEKTAGHAFPEDLRQLYRWRDGQRGKGDFPAHAGLGKGALLSLAQAEAVRQRQLGQGGGWSPSWWPIVDGGDGDLLAVELASTPAGGVGALVLFRHELAEHPRPFASIGAWLDDLVTRLAGDPRPASGAVADLAGALSEHLRRHDQPVDSWQTLRTWLRSFVALGTNVVFARLALASRPAAADGSEHPVMASLRHSIEGWLADPGETQRLALRDALAVRSRTFVPRDQVVQAVQRAAEAALAETVDQACDLALHAFAAASPGLSDAPPGAETAERCRALQRQMVATLGGAG